ncbi:MAG TPA: alpha-glucan family phosphorylase, partial [Steroidobacteraceae bacterium]|nr:alpha-glucan family phosphorylase [Steroidobacteraceae bacterium]
LRLAIRLPGGELWLRAWQVKIGRVHLYLLDSNDVANDAVFRGIAGDLYGEGAELRLQQELLLGIGGWRLLEALQLEPEVCHLNEGHAAFAVLERARSFRRRMGCSFRTALSVTRSGNIFTSHTAVPAGFDRFPAPLIERYLTRYAEQELGISVAELLSLGRADAGDAGEPFNMAYLAVRGSGLINGVSKLHGEVSRRIFLPLFPRWPAEEVPIQHVTNGVHTPGWDSAEADELWTAACGKDRWRGAQETLAAGIRSLSDASLWQCRNANRIRLIEYARAHLARQLQASGSSDEEIAAASRLFRPDVLTIGFARRFATYKRPNLLLQDRERLLRLLSNTQRPVQLILAGKAHPADAPGQALIREWVQFVRAAEVRPHALLLADYDVSMSEHFVQGVDLWINTPLRPWEACGTSGMKVLVNGGLNLSELDGWWAEAYTPAVGWALGDAKDSDSARDAADAAQLYTLLETEVIPEFYARDAQGIPRAWLARVRESMATLTPAYSANRAVREYVERCYLPAAASYRARAAREGALGAQIAERLRHLDENWPGLRFGATSVASTEGRHRFEVEVFLGALDPGAVRVELYAAPTDRGGAEHREMTPLTSRAIAAEQARVYVGEVCADRPPSDYTARIVPAVPGVAVPLESGHILWQR